MTLPKDSVEPLMYEKEKEKQRSGQLMQKKETCSESDRNIPFSRPNTKPGRAKDHIRATPEAAEGAGGVVVDQRELCLGSYESD